jgi:hypothetical protein
MGCHAKQGGTFLQRFSHHSELADAELLDCLFEVTDPAMYQLGTFARSGGTKVFLFNKQHPETAAGRIQCASGTRGATANNADVE